MKKIKVLMMNLMNPRWGEKFVVSYLINILIQ
jgi:hypothetical protein